MIPDARILDICSIIYFLLMAAERLRDRSFAYSDLAGDGKDYEDHIRGARWSQEWRQESRRLSCPQNRPSPPRL